ncbi:MAG: hypothetical protein R3351_07110 [Nitrospirales bacterium]|nr:hypothetical protein [Nitrospirales bacterium]
MGIATVAFRKCVLNLHSDGSQDDRPVFRVVFDLDIDGENYKNVYVEVREALKSGIHKRPLEISEIHGYEGPLNYAILGGSIEFYFRQIIGGKESIINKPGQFLALSDWTIEHKMVVQFEMPEDQGNEEAKGGMFKV